MATRPGSARKSWPLKLTRSLGLRLLMPTCCDGDWRSGIVRADADVPAFEECVSDREARMRERAGARGQDQG